MKDNIMKRIEIEKITLNIGVGEPGDRLDKSMKLMETITGAKPVQTKTMKRIPSWNLRPRLAIACKVTLRGKKATDVLKRLFSAVDNKILASKFDQTGNFSFGVSEYLNIPDMEYDVDVGIIGLEVAVTLKRPGFRIKNRLNKSKLGKSHKITKKESIEFINKQFNIEIEGAS